MLHVAVRDLEQLSLLIKTQIASLPGVSRSESFLVLSEVKPDGGWPIEDELFIESLENGQAKNQSESLKGGLMMKLGWIGTGVMGTSMAGHLQTAGHGLYMFNRTRQKAESLLAKGAVWCET